MGRLEGESTIIYQYDVPKGPKGTSDNLICTQTRQMFWYSCGILYLCRFYYWFM